MNAEKIKKAREELEAVLKELTNPDITSNWEKFEELSRKKEKLEKILDADKEIKETEKQIEENKTILKESEHSELTVLAETEIAQLEERKRNIEERLKSLLEEKNTGGDETTKKDNNQNQAAIIEIRAGTGGQEAALFAGDLFRMYSKYADSQEWKQKILDSHPTELGGFKEIIFEFASTNRSKSRDVFAKMKYEGGVHRVQRIPETEKSGRIHTSTATVAVLPKPKSAEIKIKADEIKIDFYHSSGPGGQNVNKRMTAVRITHLPTGIVVTSQNERNQRQNKENALAILAARIMEKKEQESQEKLGGKRKNQIGWAKRAEKIRTYNFPQDRVTDHRIKKSWHNIEKIMDGEIDKMIKTLQERLEDGEDDN
ncbi:MAG TPA: peptide chain release factor 1 [Candidatus Parcubacteria bacterium]|nr:peptide chain release factor 1 [Candidatus Parcubacteria bacterium]